MKTILSGDVGGTNTRLAILVRDGDRFTKLASRTVPSADFERLEDAVSEFLADFDQACELAAFGVAGPVIGERCEATNLPWVIDAAALRQQFGFEKVTLLNDLKAQALGIRFLRDRDLQVLHPGRPKAGNRALIAAGTGLGQAGLFFDGREHRVFATEGGHGDFAPHREIHMDLLRYLTDRHGRASWERVVSGSGLVNIFRFLVEDQNLSPAKELAAEPSAADISRFALQGSCPVADQALDIFVELYGAEAGNLALKMLAVNGLFVGGGIAPKILERLKNPSFLNAFCSKGRMSHLVREIPVKVILNGDTALYGAAGSVDALQ